MAPAEFYAAECIHGCVQRAASQVLIKTCVQWEMLRGIPVSYNTFIYWTALKSHPRPNIMVLAIWLCCLG